MKNCLILFFFCFASAGFSQNLVPNPSFEDTVMCPSGSGQVTNCAHWKVFRETPDYFQECASLSTLSVPYNYAGFQNAASGVSYMGIYTHAISESREIIGVQLLSSLETGTKYYVRFKACLAYDVLGHVTCASNNLGILGSMYEYSESIPIPYNNFSHINYESVISDSINWTLVSGEFIADSNYSYIALGNFYDYDHTDTIQLRYPGKAAYYYIDDVCVSKDSNDCKNILGIGLELKNTNPIFYFDETNNSIKYSGIDDKIYDFEIIASDGKLILKKENYLFKNKQSLVFVPPNELIIIHYKTKHTTFKFQKIITIKS